MIRTEKKDKGRSSAAHWAQVAARWNYPKKSSQCWQACHVQEEIQQCDWHAIGNRWTMPSGHESAVWLSSNGSDNQVKGNRGKSSWNVTMISKTRVVPLNTGQRNSAFRSPGKARQALRSYCRNESSSNGRPEIHINIGNGLISYSLLRYFLAAIQDENTIRAEVMTCEFWLLVIPVTSNQAQSSLAKKILLCSRPLELNNSKLGKKKSQKGASLASDYAYFPASVRS